MRRAIPITAALGFFLASGATLAEEAGAAQRNGPDEPDKKNDAATDSGQRVDPKAVRAVGTSKIAAETAAEIANALMATAPARHVTVSADVGSQLPGDLDLQPLPPAVADLVPEYRGYNYVVANDQVVIVKPSTREVVEVIGAGRAPPGGTP